MRYLSVLNVELIEELFTQQAKKKLMKEIHEWIIYTGPPEVLEMYQKYLERCNDGEIKIDE